MRPLAASLFLLLVLNLPAARADPGMLAVEDAWIRATPGTGVAAAYFTLRNTGAQALSVIGVRSPLAGSAMIHETQLVGSQSTMRPHERVHLAPGQTVRLAPGGLHVMLMDLSHALTPGEQVPLVLLLEGGASVSVSAHVRALSEE